MDPVIVDVTEQKRLNEAREAGIPWKKWGPYLSERQWGTVREDYSDDGNAWDYFTHDQARSRAYRWGEDGLGGICDDKQRLCFALALWNERDPILKERLFGLTNSEANHGEDVKEYYFYLDSTPTHSYMKYLYKYPQREYPYRDLIETNRQTIAGRVRVRAARHRRLRRRPLLRRVRGVRQGGPGRHPRPHHRAQSRAGSGPASCLADALVPQHLVVGRGRAEAVAARSGDRASSRPRTMSWASTGCTAMAPRSCSSPRTRATRSVCGASPMRLPTSRTRSTTTSSRASGEAVNPAKVGTKAAAHYVLDVPGRRQPDRPPASGGRQVRRCLRRLRRDLQKPDRRRRRILRSDYAARR